MNTKSKNGIITAMSGSPAVDPTGIIFDSTPPQPRLTAPAALLATDIDGTLVLGRDPNQSGLAELKRLLANRHPYFAFAVATGRRIERVEKIFVEFELPEPDLIICSVGTEIYAGFDRRQKDHEWARHIIHGWEAAAVRSLAVSVPGLTPQRPESQSPVKVSFLVNPVRFRLAELEGQLGSWLPQTNVILTQNTYLDLLPKRASKGHALRYACAKLGLTADQTLACGDSGNDEALLLAAGQAVVVGNYSPELEGLRRHAHIYFSPASAAAGILDGIRHFQFPPSGSAQGKSI